MEVGPGYLSAFLAIDESLERLNLSASLARYEHGVLAGPRPG